MSAVTHKKSAMRLLSKGLLYLTLAVTSACSVIPSTIVHQPTTAKAPEQHSTSDSNGAIFKTSSYRPMFEDRRPRYIGDIVTINITENTSATKAGENSSSKDASASFNADTSASVTRNIPIIGGLIPNVSKGGVPTLDATSANSYSDKADSSASNVFTGSITATVIDVRANGYLVVSGEKQVAFDKGTEFVRFSGVINPDMITQGNVVPSTKVADARIEYRTNTKVDAASIASVFARFFLSMSPW